MSALRALSVAGLAAAAGLACAWLAPPPPRLKATEGPGSGPTGSPSPAPPPFADPGTARAAAEAPSEPSLEDGAARDPLPPIRGGREDTDAPPGAARICCSHLEPAERLHAGLVLYPPGGGEEVLVGSFTGSSYTKGGLAPGLWRIRLVPRHSPWVPCESDFWIGADRIADVDLRPERGEPLRGVVLYADGAPAAAATVRASYSWSPPYPRSLHERRYREGGIHGFGESSSGGDPKDSRSVWFWPDRASLSVATDARGEFRLDGLPREGVSIRVDYEGAGLDAGTARPGGTPVEIRLPPDPPSLTVAIREPADVVGKGPWEVEVWGKASDSPRRAEASPAARFRNLPPGDYVVLVLRRGPRWGRPEFRGLARVEVPQDGGAEVVLEPDQAGVAKYSTVTERSGDPIRGVEARALVAGLALPEYWFSSGADGEFSFAPSVDFKLRLSIEGRVPVEIPLRLAPGEIRDLGAIRMRATGAR
ncbi:MAG: hypothetical protein L0216_12825 [Planctomycetales bacterium]|nr:hypothetical protein [Planctomycetales bacterium]